MMWTIINIIVIIVFAHILISDEERSKLSKFDFYFYIFALFISVIVFINVNEKLLISIFHSILWLIFWLALIGFIIFIIVKYIQIKNEEEHKHQQNIARINRQKEMEKQKLEHIQVLEQEYKRKIQQLEFIRKKNQLISEDIPEIKRFVSQLSIYDENFLEQQPALLQYIEKLIKEGKA